jgi:hypothetical protein
MSKTIYEIECEKLRALGYIPESMTIKEQFEALNGPINGPTLYEISGIDEYSEEVRSSIRDRVADKYDHYEGDDILVPLEASFWVGVKAGTYESPPLTRYMTSCYARRPVFKASDCLVFICNEMLGVRKYVLPEKEYWAIEGIPSDILKAMIDEKESQ